MNYFNFCKNIILLIFAIIVSLQTAFSQQLAGLESYVAAIESAKLQNDNKALAQGYQDLGNFYFSKNVFEKAISNHILAISLFKETNTPKLISSLEILGKSYFATAQYQEAKTTYQTLLKLYEENNQVIGVEKTLENLVWAAQNTNEPERLLAYNIQLAEFAKKNNHNLLAAKATNNIGVHYMNNKNSGVALGYFSEALKIYQANGQTEQIPLLLLNMGSCNVVQKEYEIADDYYKKAAQGYDNQANKLGKALTLNLIATNDLLQNKHDKAIMAAKEAMSIASEQQADDVLSETYLILSEIYNADGDNKQAQSYYKLHIATQEKIAEALRKRQKDNTQQELEAIKAEGAIKLTASEKAKQELAMKQLVLEAEKNTKDLELKAKQVTVLEQEKQIQQQAFTNQVLEKQRLGLEKQQVEKTLQLAQQQIEQDKKQQEIVMLQKDKEMQETKQNLQAQERQKENELNLVAKKLKDEEFENQRVKQLFITGILFLVAILLILAIYAFIKQRKGNRVLIAQQREIKEANEELASTGEELRQNMEEMQAIQEQLQTQRDELILFNEEITAQKYIIENKNASITSSINYARRIQSAFLPDKDLLKKNLSNSFIFFQPKDIVSGDFYWFAVHNNKILVAVCDCTGHGVPGALMSMIGMNLLDNLVYIQNITNPAIILTELDKGFKRQLQKPEVSINDGMDIALCEIDKETKILSFAGAHCPLTFIEDGVMTNIKGSRCAIGGENHLEKHFENHSFVIDKPKHCYIYSDGFQDQFGGTGKTRRKFLSNNLRETLLQNHAKSFVEQQMLLSNVFNDWKGAELQTDDVLVIGFKI